MDFIDLFCGIGGFHSALIKFNNRCVFASDIDKDCREVYEKNFKIKPFGDIKQIDVTKIPKFDILCAGFPCQSFSNAGKKLAFSDKRGLLFNNIIEIAKFHSPKYMFLENVKHIKKISDGKVYKYIYNSLEKIGYVIQDIEISPYDINIPQNRKRIIFLVVRKDLINDITDFKKNIKIIFEEKKEEYKKHNVDYKNTIFEKYKEPNLPKDIEKVINAWDELIGQLPKGLKMGFPLIKEYFEEITDDENKKWKNTYILKNSNFYKEFKPIIDVWWKKHEYILSRRKNWSKLEWQVGEIKDNDTIKNYYIQIRQSGIRVKKTDYFPTLVAMGQIPIYGKEMRFLSVKECSRLQYMPENFIFDNDDKKTYKQLGNAVCVNVIELAYETLMEYMKYNKK